jgi:hypothetical protein
MSSIDFFVPVIYNNQNKTTSQQILEAVDEYFYFGDKPRVTIFSPDAEHPQSWARQNHQNRHRSWTNTALKVASYFTIIPPLVALATKVLLRRCLQVSSIQVEQAFAPNSRIEAKLSAEVLRNIGSFLSHQDQAQLAQVAVFARDAALDIQQYYIDLMTPLKTEIEALPAGPLSNADFQRLLVSLVTSPASGHPKHWVPVMDALMGHLGPSDTFDGIIQKHANIAELLATSAQPISSDQVYQLCKYLGQKQLSKIMSWIGYRALEQYSLKPQLNSASVNKALKEYLSRKAKVHIRAGNDGYFLPRNQMLEFQKIDIDPRQWFGLNGEENSLWTQPGAENGEIAPMPELLLEVLWTHIQSLRTSCVDKPFMVGMRGRAEAQLPHNFILALAQRITNADIFLDHNHTTIDKAEIEKPNYARSLGYLSDAEKEALATESYPNAVVVRD